MPWLPKILCLLALLACAPLARAQANVFHCIGAHGEPVYSGQPCGTPAPAPGSPAGGDQAGRFGDVCAASPEALRQAVAGAFTRQDVNWLAGLILWRGMGGGDARTALRSLADWLRQPLLGIAMAYAAGPPLAAAGVVPAPAATHPVARVPEAFEISTGGSAGETRNFGVVAFGGCWWLTF